MTLFVAPRAEAAKTTLSAGFEKTYVNIGGKTAIRGYLTPKAANRTIIIDRYISGRWRQVNTVKTTASGYYRKEFKTSKVGRFSYRVRYGSTVSRTVTMVVTPVTYLIDMKPVASSGWGGNGAVEMNGKLYPRTTYDGHMYSTNYREYNLGRKYATLSTVVGTRDESNAAGRMAWTIYADGVIVAQGTARLGQTQAVAIDVTEVLRLRLETKRISGYSSSKTGFGDAVAKGRG